MEEYKIIRKIASGNITVDTKSFLKAYDKIFIWMIERNENRTPTLSVNIYSFDFLLIWDNSATVLMPYLQDNKFIVHINKEVEPRYGSILTKWIRDLHSMSNMLSSWFIFDINIIITSYLM